MHKISIPQSVVDGVIRRRGKEHIYDDLVPSRTALIVIDMQNAFLMPGVSHALCEMAPRIVPNINRLAMTVRRTGGTVVWVQNTFTDESYESWSIRHAMVGPEQTAKRYAALARGTTGHRLWAELDVQSTDLIVEKTRFSAFIQGSSNLEEILRARAIDTVVITGTGTNVCCDSTARDAMMRNFKTIMVTDGLAADTDDEHNASLTAFYLAFGDIMPTDLLVACLIRNAGASIRA